jgi:hypothetical protein
MGPPYIDVGYENNNINIYMSMPWAMFCVPAIHSILVEYRIVLS